MKIVCEQCGASGMPASVKQDAGAVLLECASCGHANKLDTGGEPGGGVADPSPADADSSPEPGGREPEEDAAVDRGAEGPDPNTLRVSREPAVAAHVPAVQCRKCGHRQHGKDSCVRCGFDFSLDVPGEMPWDIEDDVEATKEAVRLWERALDEGSRGAHQAFMTHCLDAGLEEFAGRRYRFRRADRPDDLLAAEQLDAMVERGRTRLMSKLDAEKVDRKIDAAALNRRILWVVFIVGVALALLFLSLYPNLF